MSILSSTADPPFEWVLRWAEAKGGLKMDTPFDSVFTADIIEGNSSDPVVNKHATS